MITALEFQYVRNLLFISKSVYMGDYKVLVLYVKVCMYLEEDSIVTQRQWD